MKRFNAFVTSTSPRSIPTPAISFRSNELSAEYVHDNLAEFELTRTDVVAGEMLVSRLSPDLFEEMPQCKDGAFRIPEKPGHGMAFTRAALKKYAV